MNPRLLMLLAGLSTLAVSRAAATSCDVTTFGALGDGLRADAAPSSSDPEPVRLRDGRGARVEKVRSARNR
jgi:hypothetical protein